ncbi:MAG: hypothetical protein HC905_00210 [Bacteroidales bacterium]|nr:hypothetical protein [Bacteroidales bacterium]
MKYLILLLAVTILACDKLSELKINSNETYNLNTSCGEIQFNASLFITTNLLVNQNIQGAGITLNLDSLKLSIVPNSSNEVIATYFTNDKGKIKDKVIQINEPQRIGLTIKLRKDLIPGTSIIVLPCSYISCQQIPLIKDTIKIKL